MSTPPEPISYPASLSASRANDFLACPLLYRYRSIDRLPEAPSAAALRGTLVHRALEVLFSMPMLERTPATATEALGQAWLELVASDALAAEVLIQDSGVVLPEGQGLVDGADDVSRGVLAPTGPLLEAYFAMEDPRSFDPHAMELGFDVGLAESFSIRGFVDRIDIASTGEVRIVDYKTGRAPAAGFEAKAMFQMRFYALAWWRMTGQIPRLLRLMYLGSQEQLNYAPQAEDLIATERKVLAIRDAIASAAERGHFPANASRLCDWCSFRAQCPAWGGSAPPMPPLPVPQMTEPADNASDDQEIDHSIDN